jgi:cell division protein FtsN
VLGALVPPPDRPAPGTARRTVGAGVAIAVVAGAASAWWFMSQRKPAPAASTPPASVIRTPAPPMPAPEPPAAPAPISPPAASAVTAPGVPSAAAAAPAQAVPPATTGASEAAFEIVVASFRTEARASSVAAQVTGAGLPVRRREAAGWQQVIAGPFASRDEADAARLRLERAGLAGAQVVPVPH